VTGHFIPPHPARRSGPVAVWRGLVGERARTLVYGWSEAAFREWHLERNVLGYRVHIPLHPDSVQRVLLDNAANYVKPALVKRLLAPTIGRGLLSSDGSLWRDQRRIVAASFTPPAVDALVPVFAEVAKESAGGWAEGKRDMAREATAATMRIISNALFSGDQRLTSAEALAHIAAALGGVSEARLQVLLNLPMIPWSPRGYRGRCGQIYLRKTLTDLVRERIAGNAPGDFVTNMIHALRERFPTDEAIELAVDNAATFYLAGHETTANAVTWTLYLLSEQAELQDFAAAEADEALAAGVDSALPDRLPLLRMILEESLRLYPSAPRFDREAVAADRLGDHDVERGDIVSIWPWLIHRHKRLWEEPDAFDHTRFAPERRRDRHRFQYLPFGGGPRMCVGARFAMAEALAILAVWLSQWRFSPIAGHIVTTSGAVTLRPANGMPLELSCRGQA
jgi:cytochrome P450